MTSGIRPYWRNFIGGEWVDGADGTRITVTDPATAEPIAEVARGTPADIDRAVRAARACFDSRVLRDQRPHRRGDLMLAVAQELGKAADEIALLECRDNGKTLANGRAEVALTQRYLTYYAGLADKLEGRQIPLGDGYVDYTTHEPYGVSGQIVPWNGPLPVGARSIACALVTGNTVVLKSPEDSPLSLFLLAEACERAGVPAGAVNIVCGYGHDAGAALAAHRGIDHIVFTGSVETGKSVLRAAAENVVPCVMELGGKSGAIVHADADLDRAAASAARGIFNHAGQICSAGSRLIVHRSIHDELVAKVRALAAARSVGPGIDGCDMGPLINARQLDRVEALCAAGRAEGATAILGGSRLEGTKGHFMQPTIFTGVRPDMRIAQEEFFGPVLVVIPFDTPEEAIAIANGTDFGLAAGVYTRDLRLAHWTADRLVAGQIYVNEWWAGGIETPFGGMKRSGYGREKGQEALLGYVQTKNIGIRL
ncbi:aldehyde dehydrogenase family protein [Paragemmobacter straminiformis]|uniref:Aldehyde dehydrogenase family protein n=1 Tax=Paragemmobacter straminiformis TaxID=2045119 RepID=A0A842IB79_9RHOB|nr:aldehyde dehydrogenase family protein [Gemmobacter straminiformis]MBC2836663.1 aldehyde dehydrogenase family protein [Gemmobacter straminiformis]